MSFYKFRQAMARARMHLAKGDFKYGTVQAELPHNSIAHEAIKKLRADGKEDDLAGKGRDVGPIRVTVRYGIENEDVERIVEFLKQQPAFTAELAATASFPPSKHSEGAAVLIAPIKAEDLFRLNKEVNKLGDFAKETSTHATIAYVKPEAVEQYKVVDLV